MSKITYFLDANLSEHVAHALHCIEQSRGDFEVISTKEALAHDASDQEIVSYVSSLNHECVIITNDKDFQKRELFSQIMSSSNIGLFVLKFRKGSRFWDKFVFIVNHWGSIRDIVNKANVPYSYSVEYPKKLKKI